MEENENNILGQEFSDFLSSKLNQQFKFLSIHRIFGGASRETYRVKLQNEEKKSQNFIYRRTQDSSLIETDQKTEYVAYSDFQDTEVPVPKLRALGE